MVDKYLKNYKTTGKCRKVQLKEPPNL